MTEIIPATNYIKLIEDAISNNETSVAIEIHLYNIFGNALVPTNFIFWLIDRCEPSDLINSEHSNHPNYPVRYTASTLICRYISKADFIEKKEISNFLLTRIIDSDMPLKLRSIIDVILTNLTVSENIIEERFESLDSVQKKIALWNPLYTSAFINFKRIELLTT